MLQNGFFSIGTRVAVILLLLNYPFKKIPISACARISFIFVNLLDYHFDAIKLSLYRHDPFTGPWKPHIILRNLAGYYYISQSTMVYYLALV